jgi:hypothetical protein
MSIFYEWPNFFASGGIFGLIWPKSFAMSLQHWQYGTVLSVLYVRHWKKAVDCRVECILFINVYRISSSVVSSPHLAPRFSDISASPAVPNRSQVNLDILLKCQQWRAQDHTIACCRNIPCWRQVINFLHQLVKHTSFSIQYNLTGHKGFLKQFWQDWSEPL